MRLAFTISTYRLVDFVKLGLAQLSKLSPESPVLVSDDASPESGAIKEVAESFSATYECSRVRRGHFANDFQSLVNALAFAEAAGADVAVKVSQRFVFRKPEGIDVIRKCFEDSNIMVATPGRPTTIIGGKRQHGFNAFSILSDVVMIRVGAMTPQDLLVMYRERLIREQQLPWASFIENTIDELHSNRFPGRTAKIEELTNPTNDPIYLRRYQATTQGYRDLALSHGFNGSYPLDEWGVLERKNYVCKPVVV